VACTKELTLYCQTSTLAKMELDLPSHNSFHQRRILTVIEQRSGTPTSIPASQLGTHCLGGLYYRVNTLLPVSTLADIEPNLPSHTCLASTLAFKMQQSRVMEG